MSQGRAWLFTLNNYTELEEEQLAEHVSEGVLTYLLYGHEVGPTNGTPHLQGYVVFPRKMRRGGVRGLPGLTRAHVECARGSFKSNLVYCSKEATNVIIMGVEPKGQGARNDLTDIRDRIMAGESIVTIADDHFGDFIRYGRGMERYAYLHQAHRSWPTINHVFVGPTRTGKTRLAYLKGGSHPDKVWLSDPTSLKWFDGYDGQDYAILDEFSGSSCSIKLLLRLLDRYPMRVQVKGGYAQWAPKVIFICSNIPIVDWYPNAHPEHVAAMMARFNYIIDFDMTTFDQLKFMPF